jgi:hypothetical protein
MGTLTSAVPGPFPLALLAKDFHCELASLLSVIVQDEIAHNLELRDAGGER